MRHLSALLRDRRGVTAIEFGLLAPVLLVGLLGLFDLGHNMYTKALLIGAIQKAARDSTIEGASGSETLLDRRVADAVRAIAPGAALTFTRRAYTSFTDVHAPEDFTDIDGDDLCNNGEPFEDANGNGAWDADRGAAGFGGARDAVLYTVTVRYPRVFAYAAMFGQSRTMLLSSATVLRNQPYGLQQVGVVATGNCT